jgi:hypothetical protein
VKRVAPEARQAEQAPLDRVQLPDKEQDYCCRWHHLPLQIHLALYHCWRWVQGLAGRHLTASVAVEALQPLHYQGWSLQVMQYGLLWQHMHHLMLAAVVAPQLQQC